MKFLYNLKLNTISFNKGYLDCLELPVHNFKCLTGSNQSMIKFTTKKFKIFWVKILWISSKCKYSKTLYKKATKSLQILNN